MADDWTAREKGGQGGGVIVANLLVTRCLSHLFVERAYSPVRKKDNNLDFSYILSTAIRSSEGVVELQFISTPSAVARRRQSAKTGGWNLAALVAQISLATLARALLLRCTHSHLLPSPCPCPQPANTLTITAPAAEQDQASSAHSARASPNLHSPLTRLRTSDLSLHMISSGD